MTTNNTNNNNKLLFCMADVGMSLSLHLEDNKHLPKKQQCSISFVKEQNVTQKGNKFQLFNSLFKGSARGRITSQVFGILCYLRKFLIHHITTKLVLSSPGTTCSNTRQPHASKHQKPSKDHRNAVLRGRILSILKDLLQILKVSSSSCFQESED